MSELVSPKIIEKIVGVPRHPTKHMGRYVRSEQTIYIMHSQECVDTGIDLRECPFSVILDRGVDPSDWEGMQSRPVVLSFDDDPLFATLRPHLIEEDDE